MWDQICLCSKSISHPSNIDCWKLIVFVITNSKTRFQSKLKQEWSSWSWFEPNKSHDAWTWNGMHNPSHRSFGCNWNTRNNHGRFHSITNRIIIQVYFKQVLFVNFIQSDNHKRILTNYNKNYYVVRNAGCAISRYTLKLSLF